MADVLLQAKSGKPGASLVTLVNGLAGPYRYVDFDVGNAQWDKQYSGARGTQGARLAGATAQNRLASWTLEAVGVSQDAMQSLISTLFTLDEEIRRYGGTITWRPQGGSYKMYLDALDSGVIVPNFDRLFHWNNRAKVVFGVVGPPFFEGLPMDVLDDFSNNPSNLIANSDFGVDTSGWDNNGSWWVNPGASLVSDNDAFFGFRGLRVITPGAAALEGVRNATFAVEAGKTYTVSLYMKANTSITLALSIGGSGFFTGNVAGGQQVLCNLDTTWQRYTLTWTANSSGAAQLGVSTTGGNRAWTWWMDGVRLEVAAVATTYDYELGRYTFDAGAQDVGISGGTLHPNVGATFTTENRLIHTDLGYTYGDHQVTLKATPGSTITSFKAGVVLKRLDALNYLEVYVDDNGVNSRLRLDKVVAGARTNLSTTNLAARVVNATPFWVRGRIEDSTVFLEYFTSAPTPMSTPTLAASSALAGGDITLFGLAAVGRAGFSWIPQQAGAVLDDLAIDAFVRRNATLPQEFALNGVIPGDAPALATISVSVASPPQPLAWALLAWAARTGASAPFGIIEAETGSSLLGWASTGDANYRGGTGLKRTTAGAENLSSLWVVDPTALAPDDYRQEELDIEVWARVELAAALVSPKLTLQCNPVSSGFNDYTTEYGSAGKLLVVPSSGTSFRFVRLGTLRISNATTYQLAVAGRCEAGSSGQFGLDYLVVCLARSRALGPTGKPRSGAGYPSFLADSNATKRVLPDLAGRFRSGAALADVPYTGMGGSLIEIPPGQVDLLVKPSQLVPDDPTSDTSTETLAYSCTVQLDDVTPRWRLARSF